jgi:hypothetical protein
LDISKDIKENSTKVKNRVALTLCSIEITNFNGAFLLLPVYFAMGCTY